MPLKNLGPVQIEYDGTPIGDTVGGASLNYSESAQETTVDRTGTIGRSRVITGVSCEVTGSIGEATYAQLQRIAGGVLETGTLSSALHLQARVGKDLRKDAKVCILKPIDEGLASTDEAEWIILPAATILASFNTSFSLENQSVYGFSIMGHPVTADEVAEDGRLENEDYKVNDVLVFGKEADLP